jgi:Flp pilus assembly protein TadG
VNRDREGGFVAIEFALGIGLLLLPVVLLVVSLPTWAERRHAATVAATEAAAVAVHAYPNDGQADAREAALESIVNAGIDRSQVDVTFDRDDVRRGGTVSVRVTVAMPALVVPGVGNAGGFRYAVVRSRRIDDYRSS